MFKNKITLEEETFKNENKVSLRVEAKNLLRPYWISSNFGLNSSSTFKEQHLRSLSCFVYIS